MSDHYKDILFQIKDYVCTITINDIGTLTNKVNWQK